MAAPRAVTPGRPRRTPPGTRLPSRGAEPVSTTGAPRPLLLIHFVPLLHEGARRTFVVATRRLDRLRQVVPHAERANTASFLEECITYIQNLQKRIAELEQLAGLAQATVSLPASPGLPGHLGLPVPAQISFSGAAQQAGASSRGGQSQGPLDPPDARDTAPIAGTIVPQASCAFCCHPNDLPWLEDRQQGSHCSKAGPRQGYLL